MKIEYDKKSKMLSISQYKSHFTLYENDLKHYLNKSKTEEQFCNMLDSAMSDYLPEEAPAIEANMTSEDYTKLYNCYKQVWNDKSTF